MDCTLRDGGFINEWRFGHGDIINLFERSVSAKIDYIEVGFLDSRENFDIDRTITPDTEGLNRIFGGLDHGTSRIFAMIDYGTCPLENIAEAKDTVIDGIRVMVKKKTRYEALKFCAELKKKGYMVFVQPVSVTGYSDEEMLELVERVNELEPFAMSIVDTYGLLDSASLLHYFKLIDDGLKPSIALGYHAHNNFQLAYSNSMAFCESETDRELLIDGSAYGMGKSAGNCPLELLTMYANSHFNKSYDTSQILEMIDTGIMKIYERSPWGYQLQYYLCASNDCHPKYAQYLIKKKTLSMRSIDEILKQIEPSERLAYNEEHIERLYLKYQNNEINDAQTIAELREALRGKEVLILGPAKSIEEKRAQIADYIVRKAPVVISINFMPRDYALRYLFISNSKRYMQLSSKLYKAHADMEIIATSNVTSASGKFDYVVDYSNLIDTDFEIPDNSLPMLLRLMTRLEPLRISLAGFDGYVAKKNENYAASDMEYEFVKDYAVKLNEYTKGVIMSIRDKLDINFVTESKYE